MQQKRLIGIQNTKMACSGNRLKTSICKIKNLIQKADNNFGCLPVSRTSYLIVINCFPITRRVMLLVQTACKYCSCYFKKYTEEADK